MPERKPPRRPGGRPAASRAPKVPATARSGTLTLPPRAPARPQEQSRPRPPEGARELKYYGRAACEALFRARPGEIIRVYLEKDLIPQFSELLKRLAADRKAYHLVTGEELEKITESVHHQGICILARERPVLTLPELLSRLKATEGTPQMLVYLDGVENPHNLGAIVRTCAHFGVRYVLGARQRLPRLSPSACRVAEGGAEQVELVFLDEPLLDLETLSKRGFRLLATSGARGTSLYRYRFPAQAILALGAELEGISAAMEEAAADLLCIPGTGKVESLNVGVAFGVIAGEFYRQQF
jgi:TrmH RNA methyltransferase